MRVEGEGFRYALRRKVFADKENLNLGGGRGGILPAVAKIE